MNDGELKQIQKLLDVAEGNLHSARNMLLTLMGEAKLPSSKHQKLAKDMNIQNDGKVIEGIFNGLEMVAPDGKNYAVPANYASKSKLIEGDALKLTIAEDGSFIFKQIGPIKRKRLIGTLTLENGDYSVLAEGKKYKVLSASITYYKGQPGNRVTIIIPKETESVWAAFESVIHDHSNKESDEGAQPKIASPQTEEAVELDNEVSDEKNEVATPEPALSEEDNVEVSEVTETELPQENQEALDAITAGLDSSDEPEITKQVKAESPTEAVIPEQVSVEDALKEETTEAEKAPDGPRIIKRGTKLPDEESLVEAETDTNAMGEEQSEKKLEKNVQELEI